MRGRDTVAPKSAWMLAAAGVGRMDEPSDRAAARGLTDC
jgi:hypothetical protein